MILSNLPRSLACSSVGSTHSGLDFQLLWGFDAQGLQAQQTHTTAAVRPTVCSLMPAENKTALVLLNLCCDRAGKFVLYAAGCYVLVSVFIAVAVLEIGKMLFWRKDSGSLHILLHELSVKLRTKRVVDEI